jgi:2-amino-4-hydroxy-6-hydroxymethyldihydropteridine diphosphokinase
MASAGIGLGANLGDAAATLEAALVQIAAEPGIRLAARSALYRTPPWGDTDQADFVNAAAIVETDLTPHELLGRLLAIEARLGRTRAKDRRWGPRAIDLDLLFYGDIEIADADLEIPHPRLFDRAFVLKPLAEIAPDRFLRGRTVSEALIAVEEDARLIVRIDDGA